MDFLIHADLPRFVSFGEALTDLLPLPGTPKGWLGALRWAARRARRWWRRWPRR
ncbi:MAG TPA: hypothetical protein VGM81_19200 [Burkholderiaceae bacterium]|jgi:hypothetical protein